MDNYIYILLFSLQFTGILILTDKLIFVIRKSKTNINKISTIIEIIFGSIYVLCGYALNLLDLKVDITLKEKALYCLITIILLILIMLIFKGIVLLFFKKKHKKKGYISINEYKEFDKIMSLDNDKKELVVYLEKDVNIYNDIVTIPKWFGKLHFDINDTSFEFSLNDDLQIKIKSDKEEQEIKDIFFMLYEYLDILLGFFPSIKKSNIIGDDEIVNIAEKYKTGEKFIHGDAVYIQELSSKVVKETFEKFINLREKISFQLFTYQVSKMKSNQYYSDIAIVNLLQTFDGLYSVLYKRKDAFKTPFIKKLYYLFDIAKYDVFKQEKKEHKYNNLMVKFKNTRNKFSHALSSNYQTLSGIESDLYIYKLSMIFRLLILQEVSLDKYIDNSKMKLSIKNIDRYISIVKK